MPIRNYASSEAGRRISPSDAAAHPGGSASKISRLVDTSRRQIPELIHLPGDSPIMHVPQPCARTSHHNVGGLRALDRSSSSSVVAETSVVPKRCELRPGFFRIASSPRGELTAGRYAR